MSASAFNTIVANLRQQFPTLSDAMILQKATELYQITLQAYVEAEKLHAEQEKRVETVEVEPESPSPTWGLNLFAGDRDKAAKRREELRQEFQAKRHQLRQQLRRRR